MSQFVGRRVMFHRLTAFGWTEGTVVEVIDEQHVRIALDHNQGQVIKEPDQTFFVIP